jgi:putative ABC transport system substrate-binding protein
MPAIVASNPDVLFFGGAKGAALAAKPLSKTIPMLAWYPDVVASGIIANLAHPEGNITGITNAAGTPVVAKLMATLAEVVPQGKRFAYLIDGAEGRVLPLYKGNYDTAFGVVAALGLSLTAALIQSGVATEDNYSPAFESMKASRVDGILVGNGETNKQATAIISKLALAARLPTMGGNELFTEAGGLMSYGIDNKAQDKQAADYLSLLLRGTKPADLPVWQGNVFLFKINLQTAKALGITIPPSILVQATNVIG